MSRLTLLLRREELFTKAFEEIDKHLSDLDTLDEDDLDDLLLCFNEDAPSLDLHGDELRTAVSEALNRIKEQLEEDQLDFKKEVASEIDEAIHSLDSTNKYGLTLHWLVYSNSPPPTRDNLEQLKISNP